MCLFFAEFVFVVHLGLYEEEEFFCGEVSHLFLFGFLCEVVGDGFFVYFNASVAVGGCVEYAAFYVVFYGEVEKIVERVFVEAFLQLLRQMGMDVGDGACIVLCVLKEFVVY